MSQPASEPPPDSREDRRLRAWELRQQGWSQRRIADELGVTQGAVSQWFKRAHGGGTEALRHHPAPGRHAALSAEQLAQLCALLGRGATAFGFSGSHWTTTRVAAVLQQMFGVTHHPAHVSRLLRKHCSGWQQLGQG